jgi:hypothetical protein
VNRRCAPSAVGRERRAIAQRLRAIPAERRFCANAALESSKRGGTGRALGVIAFDSRRQEAGSTMTIRTNIQRSLASFAFLLASACSGDMEGTEAMRGHFEEAHQELERHHGALMDVATLHEAVAEGRAYEYNMHEIIGAMHEAMRTMSHCSGGDRRAMRDAMYGMEGVMYQHSATLLAADDLAAAWADCASHVSAMRAIVAAGRDALVGMGCARME